MKVANVRSVIASPSATSSDIAVPALGWSVEHPESGSLVSDRHPTGLSIELFLVIPSLEVCS